VREASKSTSRARKQSTTDARDQLDIDPGAEATSPGGRVAMIFIEVRNAKSRRHRGWGGAAREIDGRRAHVASIGSGQGTAVAQLSMLSVQSYGSRHFCRTLARWGSSCLRQSSPLDTASCRTQPPFHAGSLSCLLACMIDDLGDSDQELGRVSGGAHI
jgi:hypothetical protein